MTCSADAGVWEVKVTFSGTANHAFKFDVHGDWNTNYGDNERDDIGDPFGNDIAVSAGAGQYEVTFNGRSRAYTIITAETPACRFPSLKLRGTHNGWDVTPMTCNDGKWQANVEFRGAPDKRFKFDIHGDWSDNYGDNEGDFVGDSFGLDIMITQGPGSYGITFDDVSRAYTVTKQ